MKKLTVIYILLSFIPFSICAQEPATEEGEDLDLQGVAALFKDS